MVTEANVVGTDTPTVPYAVWFGNELRDWRSKWQLTQAEVAQRLDVHRATIAEWEAGSIAHIQIVRFAYEALDVVVRAEKLAEWERWHWTSFARGQYPAEDAE